jgi:MFS superfamily sulfate permease-like transporter
MGYTSIAQTPIVTGLYTVIFPTLVFALLGSSRLLVLLFTLFFTVLLQDMPKAVLGGIVFLIGVSLIDLPGMKRLWIRRRSEFVVALTTAIAVFAVAVEQGIIIAVVLSLLDLIRRQYKPGDYVLGRDKTGEPVYLPAKPGTQSLPGLVIFRYDAELLYANVNRFVDQFESVISAAPDPVRWVALDCAAIPDIDYSAGVSLTNLVQFSRAHNARFVLLRPDPELLATLKAYGTLDTIGEDNIFQTLEDAFAAYHAHPHPGPAQQAGSDQAATPTPRSRDHPGGTDPDMLQRVRSTSDQPDLRRALT